MADPDCLFCKIVAGEIPSTRVDEDERTVAFMDINPATPGHVLVIPREHSTDLLEVPQEDLEACARMAQKLARKSEGSPERRRREPAQLVRESSRGRPSSTSTSTSSRGTTTDPLRLPWVPAPGDRDEIAATAQQLTG